VAFICRYGHQDVYRVLGRDPEKAPLTPLELRLFEIALFDHVQSEFTPRAERAVFTGHPGNE